MTKEQFRKIAIVMAKAKAEVENIMEGDVEFSIDRYFHSDNNVPYMRFSWWEDEHLTDCWVDDGADVENGKIVTSTLCNSMWIEKEEF